MHVGLDGNPENTGATEDKLNRHIESRLHYVPRFRKKLAWVPAYQGRPVRVDNPHFNLRFHMRYTGLPRPGGEREALKLMGRIMSRPLKSSTTPLGDLAVRAPGQSNRPDPEDSPLSHRRHQRRGHRDGSARHDEERATRRARSGMEDPPRRRPAADCSWTPSSNGTRSPRRSTGRCGRRRGPSASSCGARSKWARACFRSAAPRSSAPP